MPQPAQYAAPLPSRRARAPQAPTSLQWYLEMLPQLPPGQRPLEVVQQAGETIFVPAGACACGRVFAASCALPRHISCPI